MIALVALLMAACAPVDEASEPPTTAPAVGACIERPAADVLARAAKEAPVEFQVRPVPCGQYPNLRVTELLAESAVYSVGDPVTGRPPGPNCDPPAKRWALVTPSGSRPVVLCLADQP